MIHEGPTVTTEERRGDARPDVDLGVDAISRERDGVHACPAGPYTSRPAVAEALHELARLPLQGLDRRRSVEAVAGICATVLSDGAAVSVTLGPPTEPTLVATTAKLAQDADGALIVAQEGPAQTAWEQRRALHVPDLHRVDDWPRFARRVRGSGLRSLVAMPIHAGETPLGALNVYSAEVGAFDEHVREGLGLLASAAGAVLHEMQSKSELEELAEQLGSALRSRATIDQAKGILMVLYGEDADQAFERLVDISSRSNLKVRDVAAQVIAEAAAGLPVTGVPETGGGSAG